MLYTKITQLFHHYYQKSTETMKTRLKKFCHQNKSDSIKNIYDAKLVCFHITKPDDIREHIYLSADQCAAAIC